MYELQVFVHAAGHVRKPPQYSVILGQAAPHGLQGVGLGFQVLLSLLDPFQDLFCRLGTDIELYAVGFQVLGPLVHIG